jgi:hypothetical protein
MADTPTPSWQNDSVLVLLFEIPRKNGEICRRSTTWMDNVSEVDVDVDEWLFQLALIAQAKI